MKILVNLFHPHLDSSRVNRAWAQRLAAQPDITVRDIYALYPKGKIDITGTVHGTSADTLALHADAPGTTLGDGLSQSAPITVGNLLLLGKGSMDLSTQANKIENGGRRPQAQEPDEHEGRCR